MNDSKRESTEQLDLVIDAPAGVAPVGMLDEMLNDLGGGVLPHWSCYNDSCANG